ncbi:MAG TPA: type II secretion system F family protein [Pirellulales bacterium]|nr:type II secretion system F family protein [Pirellulales bacterium]
MSPLIISIAAFFAVAALVGGVAMLLRGEESTRSEDRLAMLTAGKPATGKGVLQETGVLSQPLNFKEGALAEFLSRFSQIKLLFVQADTSLTPSKFCVVSGLMGFAGAVAAASTGLNPLLVPIFFFLAGLLPVIWLLLRRSRRLRSFGKQLPDALELIARALRAGHSLGAGFNLVAGEMAAPIGVEFQRCYEEQNLGIPLDEALKNLTDRVPNLDLKFFCTALVLQRQTGGDLAEILDKIGSLIRDRFRIWGQVQALTGEGRLSGIVLLALPPVLFGTVYYLNPDYITVLFTDPMGKKMLAGAVLMQILGALVIRKIVNIKV